MRILFSPVGGNDPMSESNLHDGAMLHIARHYKPDKIYLLFSEKMIKNREVDHEKEFKEASANEPSDRYHYCLRKLSDKIGHPFIVEDIDRPNLEVFVFESVFREVEEILFSITDQLKEDDELLLNITSGTPPMQSALLILATMLDIPCKCIQADTPIRDQNDHIHSEQYDVRECWECNFDNQYTEGDTNYNRTHEEQLFSLKRLKYEEVIKKHVNAYDYHSAYMLALEMPARETIEYIDCLEIAEARMALDSKTVERLIPRVEKKEQRYFIPMNDTSSREILEYALTLRVRVERTEYGDFLRGLSPVIVKLFENVVESHANIKISDYTIWDGEKDVWNPQAISSNPTLSNARFIKNRDKLSYIQTYQLIHIMYAYGMNRRMISEMERLRKIEKTVRNLAAHTMVAVSDEWVKRKTGYTCEEIMSMLIKAFSYSGYNIKQEYWESYVMMNKIILSKI